tara:strand:+ start:586 stop:783 length:198 start_codon:yes stop_codon:yes gene_type:complete
VKLLGDWLAVIVKKNLYSKETDSSYLKIRASKLSTLFVGQWLRMRLKEQTESLVKVAEEKEYAIQ